MSSARVRVGISTCPNDTYAFHALLERSVRVRGLELEIVLADIEELNRALLAGELDVAKASYAAVLPRAADFLVLPAGSALGFGVGPLLLAAREGLAPERAVRAADGSERAPRVLLPGEHTTAALLYRLFHGEHGDVRHVVFSRILPALAAGDAELGVCIHEARFTWREHGLALVEDLGTLWEDRTGAPLPLGGLFAQRALGESAALALAAAVRRSIEHAAADRVGALATMRRHAQELSDDVLWRHVELYVNAWTSDLGTQGRAALASFAAEARRAGLVGAGAAFAVAGA